MLIYLFKSVACMAIFFLFYKLLLEREKMHVFKRIYLLLACIIALIIPALVFTEYVVVDPSPIIETQQVIATDYDYIGVPVALEEDVLDIEPILWTIYFIGLTFFGFKFIRNLNQIIRRIRKNPKQKSASIIQVLLQENFPPHTFFKYIFLNKKKLESEEIPKEVLLHEETHAKQRHSFDVIFIELLQVVFWINPFVFLFKKAIKLNHEFLADQAVLEKDVDQQTYQNTLLSYLSPDSANKYQSKMANAINYSSIKKRFTVMKKRSSKKSVVLRSLLLLPLIAVMLLGFSETKLVPQESEIAKHIKEELKEINKLPINYLDVPGKQPTQKNLNEWQNSENYAIWIDSKHVKNNILKKHEPSDFGNYSLSYVYDNARSQKFPQPYQLSLTTQKEYKKQLKRDAETITIVINKKGQILFYGELNLIPLSKVEDVFQKQLNSKKDVLRVLIKVEEKTPKKVINKINEIVSKYNIPSVSVLGPEKAFKVINTESKNVQTQEGASPEQIEYYYAFAKKHTKETIAQRRKTPSSVLQKITTIYAQMNTAQRNAVAKAFPNLPPPPPPGEAEAQEGATKAQLAEYNRLAKKYNQQKEGNRNIRFEDVGVLYSTYELMTKAQKEASEPFPNIPPPPPPASQQEIDTRSTYKTPSGETIKILKEITPEELKEYNSLAKKYNMMLSKKNRSIQIKMQDVARLEYLYGLMSDKQKEKAETFPDFPPPPPMPEAPNAPEPPEIPEDYRLAIREQETALMEQEIALVESKSQIRQSVHALREQETALKEQEIALVESKSQVKQSGYALREQETALKEREIALVEHTKELAQMEVPPPPKSPLEHVREMAEKDAIFYYEGKKISSDKAIKIIKKNKSINIDSRRSNTDKPTVRLSTKPIIINH